MLKLPDDFLGLPPPGESALSSKALPVLVCGAMVMLIFFGFAAGEFPSITDAGEGCAEAAAASATARKRGEAQHS